METKLISFSAVEIWLEKKDCNQAMTVCWVFLKIQENMFHYPNLDSTEPEIDIEFP